MVPARYGRAIRSVAVIVGLGLFTYAMLSASSSQPSGSQPSASQPSASAATGDADGTVDPASEPGGSTPAEPGGGLAEGQRAVAVSAEPGLGLSAGDRVEVVGIRAALEATAEVLGTGTVLIVDDTVVVLAVERSVAVQIVTVQTDGVVRLLTVDGPGTEP